MEEEEEEERRRCAGGGGGGGGQQRGEMQQWVGRRDVFQLHVLLLFLLFFSPSSGASEVQLSARLAL